MRDGTASLTFFRPSRHAASSLCDGFFELMRIAPSANPRKTSRTHEGLRRGDLVEIVVKTERIFLGRQSMRTNRVGHYHHVIRVRRLPFMAVGVRLSIFVDLCAVPTVATACLPLQIFIPPRS